MKVKPVIPGAVIRDPHTKRPLPAEGGNVPEDNFWVRRWLGIPGIDGEIWKLEGNEWVRRKANGELVREPYVEPVAAAPTGTEPLTPLTTREVK